MYPNPARDVVQLRFLDASPKEIVVMDALGRLAYRMSNVNVPNIQLSLNGMASGVYWVGVSDGTNRKVRKLIKP